MTLSGLAKSNHHSVFCNRSLRLDQIDMVGFDMDYTLAVYNQPEVDRLSIEATVAKLVQRGYPSLLLELPYRSDFAVRGLLVDKMSGNVLKMDRHRYIKRAYHGLRSLSRHERREVYHTRRLRPGTARYHWVDTLYSLSEVSVYAAVIEALETHQKAVDYDRLFSDVRECIDMAHQDGSILDRIAADLPRFIHRDAALPATLERFRQSGKQLFLLTNSPPGYTELMMSYLIGGNAAASSWRSYFDIIIAASCKPRFFTERQPFRRVHDGQVDDGETFVAGELYSQGNIEELEKRAGVGGDRILYIGDHIYGDVLRAKKDSAWRTVMIVQEMSDELRALQRCSEEIRSIDALENLRDRLYDQLREAQMAGIEDEGTHKLRSQLTAIDEQHAALEDKVDQSFHPFWGSIFKAGAELSSFGDQLEQYACLYTSRVSHFLDYSPVHYFRSPRVRLPHER